MKAFRQLNFSLEHRLVWSYAATLVLAGMALMLRPVMAQDNAQYPEINLEIKNVYDPHGNLVRVDSVTTLIRSGKSYPLAASDSLRDMVFGDISVFLPRNFDASPAGVMPPGPPLHRFWNWNPADSTAHSCLDEYFDGDFNSHFISRFYALCPASPRIMPGYVHPPVQPPDRTARTGH